MLKSCEKVETNVYALEVALEGDAFKAAVTKAYTKAKFGTDTIAPLYKYNNESYSAFYSTAMLNVVVYSVSVFMFLYYNVFLSLFFLTAMFSF